MFGNSKPWVGRKWIYTDHQGYVFQYREQDKKYIRQHRLVMEEQLGRPLEKHERVHHINGKRDDNRPENLELVTLNHHAVVKVKDLYGGEVKKLTEEIYELKQRLVELEAKMIPTGE